MKTITLHSNIKQNLSIYTSSIDNEAVMLNIELGKYFGMNSIASDIWNKLKTATTVENLIKSLCDDYAIAPEECQADVIPFLELLVTNGLIEIENYAPA